MGEGLSRLFGGSACAVALLASLAGCARKPDSADSAPTADNAAVSTTGNEAAPIAPGGTAGMGAPAPAPQKTLGLDGLGQLRLGHPVPPRGSWAERGAQTGADCSTVTSPDYPGVYAIVRGGTVRRITIGGRSDVKVAEGVGVGTPEAEVRRWFAGFRVEPHKYAPAPAKYLTAPNAPGGDPALRIEIGQDDRVSLIHVGMMPELGYVEGCS